jgi:hypothetical protein
MPTLSTKAKSSAAGFPEPSLLRVDDLSGGLDLRRAPSLLKPARARRLRNWSLEEPGALLTFPGWLTRSTTSLASRRLQGGQRVYLSGVTPFTLAADNGSVYIPSDAGVWGASVLSGLHATNDVFFPYDRDMVAVFDGSNVPKKSTNGTAWTQMGITPPPTAPTASAVAGGSLTDASTYEFSYTFVDTALGAESNASTTVQQAVAGANLTVRVAVTASADAQVDEIWIYARDVTGGETIRRKVGTKANTTGNFDVTAENWSSAVEEPTDKTVPPALAFGVLWKNRWWARHATVKNRLHFTQIFEPQSWPALYFIDIPFEKGDEITALIAFGDTLVVFGQTSKPFLVIGQTSLDFEVRPSAAAEAGALGPRAVCLIENGILHAAAEGVYIFDGVTDRLLSYDIAPGWADLVSGASTAALPKVPMVYDRTRKEVRVAVPRLYPYSTAGEWVLDLNRTRLQEVPAWTSTDRAIGGYIPWDGNESTLGNRGRLWSWKDATAELCEEAIGSTADGDDMVCDYEGPTFTTGLPVARFIELYGEYQPTSGTFGLEVLVDGVTVSTPTVSISGNLSTYGTSLYGTGTYAGAGRKPFVKMLPARAEGRSIHLKATYNGQARYRWFSYATSVVAEAAPRGM